MNCPNSHGLMVKKKTKKKLDFRGEHLIIPASLYVCETCGLEAGSQEQTASLQHAISDAYRKKVGLLTGHEIRRRRKSLGLTQQNLSDQLKIGIASIKRWEGSLIQTKSMDQALRSIFNPAIGKNTYTGGRALSLARVKLVLKNF